MPDGSLLYVSDADGWFQVVRLTADGHDRIVLTAGEREHGEPAGGVGLCAAPVARRQPVRPCRGPRRPVDLVVARPGRRRRRRSGDAVARRRRRGPSRRPAPVADQPVGRRLALGRLAVGRRVGRGGRRERDPAAGPLAPAGPRRRPGRRATAPGHRLDARRARRGPRAGRGSRPASGSTLTARDGLRLEGTLWRPVAATGKRGGRRVPTIVYPHGGPTWQSFRELPAVQAAAGRGRVRLPRHRLPRVDRLRPRVPPRQPRRVGPCRRQRRDRRRALGRGAALVRRPPRRLRRLVRRLPGAQRPRRGARRCGAPASTCSATPRSPRATATATGPVGSTSSG